LDLKETIGITTSGNLTFGTAEVSIPESYAVVFECPHGKFIISKMPKAKDLFLSLKEGKTYTCYYREVYEVKCLYDGDIKIRELSRTLVKYDFVEVR